MLYIGDMGRKASSFLRTCVWCGAEKNIQEMRHPESTKGKAPTTCHACREAHPGEGWCDFHNEPHPKSDFTPNSRPIGIRNTCVSSQSYLASIERGTEDLTCESCAKAQKSWEFRGGRAKSATCRTCESVHPEEKWCRGCRLWMPVANFTYNGLRGAGFYQSRCKPCLAAHAHNTTTAKLMELQGSAYPECAACGSVEKLKVDHSHQCCPSEKSCGECVRGWLCHSCNTAEGLLRTSARARKLAKYMAKHSL